MGQQLKIILLVVALVVAGLAALGIYYGTQRPNGEEVAGTTVPQQLAAVPPPAGEQPAEAEAAPAGSPSFDIVRVEPSGEVVAAGRAAPGARVELLLGDDVIAGAEANESGEWAAVLDESLAPGGYDLALRATGPDGGDWIDGDRATVVLEGADKTPLVAVTRPGEPTEVLQKPEASEQAAVAEAPATAEPAAEEQPAAGEPETAPQVAAASEPTQEPSAQDRPAEEQPAAAPADAAGTEVAIETVEVEDPDRLMLAGRAAAGEAVRLYLNNAPLGDAATGADGRWSLSTTHPMSPGRYEVRADVVGGDGSVKGRAEVRFDRVQVVAAGEEPPAGAAATQEAADAAAGPSEEGSEVTIVARTAGTGAASADSVGAGAGTSVVVIARGDNLWRIARKIYGKGIRHTVIYEANRNQIRNPHRIYPGQVFTIPVLDEEEKPQG